MENPGTDPEYPLPTITDAITRANKRKFVGNAAVTIRLLSDYEIGNDTLRIYHPDLIQNRYCTIVGWEPNSSAQGGVKI